MGTLKKREPTIPGGKLFDKVLIRLLTALFTLTKSLISSQRLGGQLEKDGGRTRVEGCHHRELREIQTILRTG